MRRPASGRGTLAGLAALALATAASLTGCGTVQQAGTWAGPASPASPTSSGKATPAVSASASPTPKVTPAYNVQPLLDPAHKYLGLEIPNAPDSIAPVQQFASWVGKPPNLIGNYVAWGTAFDAKGAQNAWNYGGMYFMVWEPWNTSCDQIAAGASDSYITTFAKAVRTLNVPIALSFGHEMNGNWYPWGTEQTSAAQFVAAWQHIHDLFAAAGATNVIWVWDPNNIYPVPDVPLEPYYPGDDYVNWVGITGYWRQGGPNTFDSLFEPTIKEIQDFSSKPILIAETSVEPGSDEVSSVEALFNTVQDNSDIIGFVWYDYDKGGDWRLENRSSVKTAFAEHVANSIFGFNVTQPG